MEWTNMFAQACPDLFSFAKNKFITMQQENMALSLLNLFHLPLLVQAFDQLQDLVQWLKEILPCSEPDYWTYIWGTFLFTPSKAYKHLIGHRQHLVYNWLWNFS
jgi:hypothetical protein